MTLKLLRGGSWISDPKSCRSASRLHDGPDDTYIGHGFRVVCNEPEPSIPTLKLLRGGSWNDFPWECRADSRSYDEPGDTFDNGGFRVVCNE